MSGAGQQKIALVTGGGSGIGRAVALGLAGAGWQVAIAGRRREALEETAAAAPGGMLVAPADLTDPAAVDGVFAAVKDRFGRLDLLFNNAGIGAPAVPLEELAPAQWQAVIATNVSAVFYAIQAAFRIMRDQDPRGGRIINNGSISAHVPRPHSAPYTASKHAVAGLTKSASLDGRRLGIAVGQIDIGNVESAMTSRMAGGVLQADGTTRPEPTFAVAHVVDAVLYMAGLPLDANVQTLTVMATAMPYVGRG